MREAGQPLRPFDIAMLNLLEYSEIRSRRSVIGIRSRKVGPFLMRALIIALFGIDDSELVAGIGLIRIETQREQNFLLRLRIHPDALEGQSKIEVGLGMIGAEERRQP